MTVYTLENIEKIMFDGFEYSLDSKVIELIKHLAEKVGAPEYIKTPHFIKSKHKNSQDISDDDWEAIRKLNRTEFIKKEGIEASIDKIRVNLNKLTDKMYSKQRDNIFEEIEKIKSYSGDNLNLHLNKISETIFNIASGNSFFSELYANIYNELVNKYAFIKVTLDERFHNFEQIFIKIEWADPNEDYDRFCELNIVNEKRRAISLFYINLMKKSLVSIDQIVTILNDLQLKLRKYMKDITNKPICEELSEILSILIINSWTTISDDDKNKIYNEVSTISKMKNKDEPGISNKTIFKHMDIKDALDKLN